METHDETDCEARAIFFCEVGFSGYLTGHTTSDILNEYTSLDPVAAMQKYFSTIQPLLDAIKNRADQLGLSAS